MTLAHELGHAFHNVNIYDHRPLNKGYSMPVAETASNFNECIVNGYGPSPTPGATPSSMALIESQLSDTTQIICDILSRYPLRERGLRAARRPLHGQRRPLRR